MKQKIVIDLPITSDRCRSKAMRIAVSSAGVISVNIDKEKNHLVVIGVGVDFFKLMKCLKRKFRCASIVSVEEVKPPPTDEEKKKQEQKKKEEEKKKQEEEEKECLEKCKQYWKINCPPPNPPCVQYYPICQPVYDQCNSGCSLM